MVKKIITHIGFWITFIVLWSAHDLLYHGDFFNLLRENLYTFTLYAILVYFNLYVLVSNFLLKNKVITYFLLIGISITITVFLSSWNFYFYFTQIRPNRSTALFFQSDQGKIIILTEIIVLIGFSMTFFLLNEWHKKERYAVEAEQKRLEAELQQLKNQVNPHFLFNSLNSIYVMLGKNVSTGKKMLIQFSDILSHQLYETNKERIKLKKEIENLQNYIKIESVRHQDLAEVNIKFPKNTDKFYISPMLLLPIVENAFKHGQSNNGYWVNIDGKIISHKKLEFTVENNKLEINNASKNGIGLINLKRRLELIYPKKHELIISDEKSTFKVVLKLELDEN